MTALTIEDIPDDVLRVVKDHAKQAGQSLQTYVRSMFIRDAAPTAPTESAVSIEEARGHRTAHRLSGSANKPRDLAASVKSQPESAAASSSREAEAEQFLRQARGSANNPEFQGWTTDQRMEFLRGE